MLAVRPSALIGYSTVRIGGRKQSVEFCYGTRQRSTRRGRERAIAFQTSSFEFVHATTYPWNAAAFRCVALDRQLQTQPLIAADPNLGSLQGDATGLFSNYYGWVMASPNVSPDRIHDACNCEHLSMDQVTSQTNVSLRRLSNAIDYEVAGLSACLRLTINGTANFCTNLGFAILSPFT